jgi:hypothetical protein
MQQQALNTAMIHVTPNLIAGIGPFMLRPSTQHSRLA